jgi:hypothetical protein
MQIVLIHIGLRHSCAMRFYLEKCSARETAYPYAHPYEYTLHSFTEILHCWLVSCCACRGCCACRCCSALLVVAAMLYANFNLELAVFFIVVDLCVHQLTMLGRTLRAASVARISYVGSRFAALTVRASK